MGWFEKQIKQSADLDQQAFEDSLFRVAGVIIGKDSAAALGASRYNAEKAIDDILRYYRFKAVKI